MIWYNHHTRQYTIIQYIYIYTVYTSLYDVYWNLYDSSHEHLGWRCISGVHLQTLCNRIWKSWCSLMCVCVCWRWRNFQGFSTESPITKTDHLSTKINWQLHRLKKTQRLTKHGKTRNIWLIDTTLKGMRHAPCICMASRFPPVFSLEFPKGTRFGGVKTREDGTQTLTWLLSHGATDEGPEYWRRLPHLGVEAESIMCLEPIWKNPIWAIRDILIRIFTYQFWIRMFADSPYTKQYSSTCNDLQGPDEVVTTKCVEIPNEEILDVGTFFVPKSHQSNVDVSSFGNRCFFTIITISYYRRKWWDWKL